MWNGNRKANARLLSQWSVLSSSRMFCGAFSNAPQNCPKEVKESSVFLPSSIPPWVKGSPTKINSSKIWDSVHRLRGFGSEAGNEVSGQRLRVVVISWEPGGLGPGGSAVEEMSNTDVRPTRHNPALAILVHCGSCHGSS